MSFPNCKGKISLFSKEISGFFPVFADFGLQSGKIGEFCLGAEEFVKFQRDGLAVQIRFKVQYPRLNGDVVTFHRGAGTDVGVFQF